MKLAIFTLCLIATCSFAFRPAVNDRKENVEAFTRGFLKGVSEDAIFDNIKECLHDSKTFFDDINNGIALILTKDPAKVKKGIALIGEAVQFIPTAARDCKAAEADIQKLIKFAKSFTSPQAFLYHIGKSLLINRVEVIKEINNAVAAYQKQDYYNLGYWVGRAMDTIFLGTDRPLSQEFVDHLNEISGWKAEIPERFRGMTIAQIKAQLLGAIPNDKMFEGIPVYNYEGATNDIPENFNSADKWPGCVHGIRDQGHCGSCWAFAATEVLSDRFCIASDKKIDVVLSPQYLVSCNTANYGCNGGYPYLSWTFLVSDGCVTDSCFPYASYDGTSPRCNTFTKCDDGQPIKKYYSTKGSIAQLGNPISIQTNILQYGPAEAAFSVYEDFLTYKSGIYKHTSGALLGGHAVKVIGWGRENGENYWLVANSWGTSWGENGYFKIAFGQCGFDRAVIAGQADIARSQTTRFSWY